MSWEKSPTHKLNQAEISVINVTAQLDDLEEKVCLYTPKPLVLSYDYKVSIYK